MNEIDFKVLTEKKLLIVPDQTEGMMVTPIDQTLRAALKVELARNFGIWLKNDMGVTAEFVMDFFRWLKDHEKLMTQPYFPGLLPVDQAGVETTDLINRSIKIVNTITRSCYLRTIMGEKRPDSLEFSWLEREMKDDNGPTKVLAGFLAKHLEGKKIKATRKERRLFMWSLDRIPNLYSYPHHRSIDMTDLWKKVALWIHPSDYPDLPDAQRFLFYVLEPEKKKEPEKPKLRKLMWKGWEEGKDFDVFESYIDQPRITVKDILISIRDYERCPRVSRWKRTKGVEIGKEKVGQEEIEVVDLMLLQLKEKLLGMLKPKKINLKIPPSFYKVPAHSILKHSLVIADSQIDDAVVSFNITAPEYVHILTYDLKGNEQCLRIWKDLDQDFLIVGYQIGGWNRTFLIVSFYDASGSLIEKDKIRVLEDVRSLVLFGYNSSTRTLRWLGEPSKTFYAGKPSKIKDWKKVWEIMMERKPILTLGELAERMYECEGEPIGELTIERMRRDL